MVSTIRRHARGASVPATIVGRDEELSLIADVLEAAGRGSGGAVAVYGEPGIGKSALLQAATAACGFKVLRAACDPSDRHRRLGTLHDLVPELRRDMGVGPVNGTDVGVTDADRLFAAHPRLGVAEPVVLAVDDAHWADDESLLYLGRMTRTLGRRSIAVVLTAREREQPVELRRFLSQLTRRDVLTEVVLGALEEPAVRALTAALVRGEPDASLALRVTAAKGNPRYVGDIVAAHAGAGDVDAAGRPAHAVPAEQRLSELGELSADTRGVLGLAALLGPRFTARDLCTVTGRSMTDLLPVVREALGAAILGEADADSLEFRHDVVRAALFHDLPGAVRAELHREIAAALERSGAEPVTVGYHLLRGSLAPPDLDWAGRVASAAFAGSTDISVALWRRMRSVAAIGDPRRTEAEAGLAAAHLAAGQLRQAESTARRALGRGVQPGRAGELELTLSTSLLRQGRWRAALSAAESAAASPLLFPAERAEQRAVASAAALHGGDRESALRALERAERASVESGASRARIRVLVVRGQLAHRSGDLAEAEAQFREAARLAATARGDDLHDLPVHAHLAMTLADQDRLEEAQAVLQQAHDAALAHGSTCARAAALQGRAWLLLDQGRLVEAVVAVDAVLSVGDEGLEVLQPVLFARRALLALHLRGPADAERWLDRLPENLDAARHQVGAGWVARARAAVRLEHGDSEGRLRELQDGWAGCAEAGLLLDLVPLGTELVVAASRTGETACAQEAAATLTELADRNPGVGSLFAEARAAQALAEEGTTPEALIAASQLWQQSPRRVQGARIAEHVAERLAALGRQKEARLVAAEALAGYEKAEALHDVQRLRAGRRRLRSAPGSRPQLRPRRGWDALTRAERVVAEFVERGNTNAEIASQLVVSRRTVESHVSHILAKLQLRSRAELILAAAQEGRLPDPSTDAGHAPGPGPA